METLKKEHIFVVEKDRSNNEHAKNGHHSPCQYRRGIRVDPKLFTSRTQSKDDIQDTGK